ncbi:hypothetical protein PYH37_005539 [Sinorhizobium numidicum]|uniref:Uncharacterized protein n=1 Tax=Sinorhizobium numidicum TaxID=680248 RepID=A0ABY8D291_9HYPH|nr:hypothetical protein [Sinorhizobium numidicum]WEX77154.1 hypothetical protein PYH37_005539 [Sinorhizobium numidicum]WEX83813.1 hypothetical protein PYH38_002632 [Sinorhizobium numidicum]
MLKAFTAVSCACVLIELASINPVAAENVPKELVGQSFDAHFWHSAAQVLEPAGRANC